MIPKFEEYRYLTKTLRSVLSDFVMKFHMLIIPLFISVLLITNCDHPLPEESGLVKTGAEILIENHLEELDGYRVGLVMNPTARIGETHMLDTLMAEGVNITALYAPEHGFRGDAGAGERIEDGVDQDTGLTVFSLYGDTRKPTPEMLEAVDLLLFDMQDVGTRFYTYNATLGLVLEAASEQHKKVWVLDRPNPIGGDYISGWILEPEFSSFVGMYPIPVAHGMTLGELGQMIIGEEWINLASDPDYRVIQMTGWNRSMLWPETGLQWVPPSPNLPAFEHAYAYPGTCFIEGTTLSEGRGTNDPFLTLGSPGTHFSTDALQQLQSDLQGVVLERTFFTPESMPGRALNPKHKGEKCMGIRIRITDYDLMDPVITGLRIMEFLLKHTPNAETNDFLYRLAGTREIDNMIKEDTIHIWHFNTTEFEELRRKYLLYE
jgi:uncharacterized protein YbbC (DUF1343 family)